MDFYKVFSEKFESLTQNVPEERRNKMFTFYAGRVKCQDDIRTMEIAIDMENLANKTCDEMNITHPLEREQFITNVIICNMIKFSSEEDIMKYFSLINDIAACMTPSKKHVGMTKLNALLCMVANAYVYNHPKFIDTFINQPNEVNKIDVDVSRGDVAPVFENIQRTEERVS
jgi:hypothetical protein